MFASGGGAPKKHSSELPSEALCAADTLEKLGAVESTSGIWRTRTVRLPLVNRTSVVSSWEYCFFLWHVLNIYSLL